ncbi:orf116 [Lactobacillus phage LP65]|uniref:Orf116 n=1 Tax=Lactobacillus phage LP65 TaxID=2892344 RepID=Q5ULJ8_9CAUD|nr:hypothetical protein LP65_gp116 [Lactobacillus phage LP65]AAV35936.1 orf116 [Lactobacillus phage LP65]
MDNKINRVSNTINVTGKQLVDMARDMFKTASPSIVQIQYGYEYATTN